MRVWSVAPIRIADCGGWTDTWFAEHGSVCCLAASPYVEVQVEVVPEPGLLTVSAENFGTQFVPSPDRLHHPLIEAAFELLAIPRDLGYRFNLFSEMPPGAGAGTSASVAVALVAALDFLRQGSMSRKDLAQAAFHIETVLLKQQSGVQDQLCAAYGGVLDIAVGPYPEAQVNTLELREDVRWELDHRLALVYFGESHDSHGIHSKVIANLESAGPEHPPLNKLRKQALLAREALERGDLPEYGRVLVANNEAQAELHPELIGSKARQLFEIARAHGAAGWKVNGAGGSGGSATLLCGPDRALQRAFLAAIPSEIPGCRVIPIRLDRYGSRVWSR